MQQFRIVSLCPSTTLTMFDFGLAEALVGRTIFCIKPEKKVDAIAKIGGTKNPNFDKIKKLNPTHILFNMEENDASHLAELEHMCSVIVTTPTDIESTISMLHAFGTAFSRKAEASLWEQRIRAELLAIPKVNGTFRYLYVIWRNPVMVAGSNTYIDYLFGLFGGVNVAQEISDKRYATLTETDLHKARADRIYLSSEPFPFKEKHIAEFEPFCNDIQLINGEAASWHGTYTVIGLQYLKRVLIS